jgi:hypothetical protein
MFLWIDLKPTLDRIILIIIRIGRDNPMFLASKASTSHFYRGWLPNHRVVAISFVILVLRPGQPYVPNTSEAHSAVTATHRLLLRPGQPYVPSSKAVCYRVVYFLITLKLFFSGVRKLDDVPKSCLSHFMYFLNFSNLLYILIYRSV